MEVPRCDAKLMSEKGQSLQIALRDELSSGCETDAARATGNDDNLVREAAHPRFTGARIP
jgi:hypothetical protein